MIVDTLAYGLVLIAIFGSGYFTAKAVDRWRSESHHRIELPSLLRPRGRLEEQPAANLFIDAAIGFVTGIVLYVLWFANR
jgi:hypothetical protein